MIFLGIRSSTDHPANGAVRHFHCRFCIPLGWFWQRDGLQSLQWYHDSNCIPVYRYTGIQGLQKVYRGVQVGIQAYRSVGSLQKVYRLNFGVGIVECSILLGMYQLASIVRHVFGFHHSLCPLALPVLLLSVVCCVARSQQKKKKYQENDAPPEVMKRKIVFSDLRNPPNNFTPLFGEVAKFGTLTKNFEQWSCDGEEAERSLPQTT